MAAKYKYRIPRSPKSDPQRNLVYRMESECIGARSYQSMSRKNITRLANGICSVYQLRRVKFVYKNLGKWAAQWVPPNTVELNTCKRTSMDFITITHELAHHLHASFGAHIELQQSHGPEFMACHMNILDTCRGIPICAMRVICKEYGIKYKDPGDRRHLGDLRRAINSGGKQ